jgi:hypothetical protein
VTEGIHVTVIDPTKPETFGIATCGHEDLLGYFAGTPCGPCVRDAHRKVADR